MRVAVLGAGGTIAPALVRDLAESPEVDGLTLLDMDGARARAVAEAHGGFKATAAAVDASDPQALMLALEGCGLLVNAASYRVNLRAMDASIAAGCGYIDLGGLYHVTAQQLERSDELAERGLLEQLDRWPRLRLEQLPGAVHTLQSLPAQAAAHALIDREVERLL